MLRPKSVRVTQVWEPAKVACLREKSILEEFVAEHGHSDLGIM